MSAIQIIILLFVLFVWWRLWERLKQGELPVREFLEWFLFWLVVAAFVLVPEGTSYLARLLGVGRGADLAIYISLLIIFYLLFKIFIRVEKTERQLTSMVRHLALRDADKPKSPNTAKPNAGK